MSLQLGACAFPVIEFDEQSTPKRLAYRGGYPAESPPPSASGSPLPSPSHRAHASVIGPIVPENEPPSPERASACHEKLQRAGVRFRVLDPRDTPGVAYPIVLEGPVHGVWFEVMDNSTVHAILDCRLALSLLDWSRELRAAGVRRVEHYSMYRPGARIGGDGAISSHAHGLAIDAARFELDNGVVLDVRDDWEGRKLGGAPCPVRRQENRASRILREVTCSAAEHRVFQIVLTPHYNKAHFNHVHLERKPNVTWTFVR